MESTDCRMVSTDDEKDCVSDGSNNANDIYSGKHGNTTERQYTPPIQERQYTSPREDYHSSIERSSEEGRRFHQSLRRYNKCRNVTANDINVLKYYGFIDSEEKPTSTYYNYMNRLKSKARRNDCFKHRQGELFYIDKLEREMKNMQTTLFMLKRNLKNRRRYY